ncbi:MAG: plastocyanin/azurin family copper-binding protein [Nitriliruptoraceae bacterium]
MRSLTPARTRPRGLLLAIVGVIALVLTACGGGDADPSAGSEGADEAADDVLRVVGQDDLRWDVEELTAQAGTVEFELVCGDAVNHNLVIDEVDAEVAACAPGETVRGTVDLEPGTYTYVCTVPGHETTMRGELVVE